MTYEDIILTLSRKYKISLLECERIVDSEFRLVTNCIQGGEIKVINIPGLGKFTPNKSRLNKKLSKENVNKVDKEEVHTGESDSTGNLEQGI